MQCDPQWSFEEKLHLTLSYFKAKEMGFCTPLPIFGYEVS